MNPQAEQARELVAAAERDIVTFDVLFRAAEAPIEATLFHAQQALEKMIKAALVRQGVVFRRTHDLVELFELAAAAGIAIPVSRELLARLGPYAVEFRYLGVRAPQVSTQEAAKAIASMREWIRLTQAD
ncbi:MAG: HEPN domain-containing protein [Betaproteobacteria bacterium]|nr:HEPN domain-containing protein [Betaproteobacteria bacterium]